MICQTVEQLSPIIGTRPACRALGAAPATIYRRRKPPPPAPCQRCSASSTASPVQPRRSRRLRLIADSVPERSLRVGSAGASTGAGRVSEADRSPARPPRLGVTSIRHQRAGWRYCLGGAAAPGAAIV